MVIERKEKKRGSNEISFSIECSNKICKDIRPISVRVIFFTGRKYWFSHLTKKEAKIFLQKYNHTEKL